MNEQHLEGYLHLVQALLSCPSGEEAAILNANSELLDAGLVQVMTQVSENLAENGEQNAASFLQSVATQIIELVKKPSITESPEDLTFLLDLLQVVSDTDADTRVVYQFLQFNLDKLDVKLIAVLQGWVTTFLSEATADEAEAVVSIICNFGNLIKQFPLGRRNVNIELAIVAYQIGLSFFNREFYPENWALCETNLGMAYNHRIIGQRSENLEVAIQCYQAALEVYTRAAFPQQWASLQNSLANAYSDRILGVRAENLEIAIACYTSALEVYTLTDFPAQWATTQNNLGTAYKSRIRGNRAENLEMAIYFYQAALPVRSREAFPEQWAATQNNLATVYRDRILGNRAENLETAISCYQYALQFYTRENFPSDWAMIINNLGIAYQDRIFGDQTENLENAIGCYQAALEVRSREAFPEQWAATQNNLGTAYQSRIEGNRSENLEMAICCYQAALEVRTRDAFPEQWAATQSNWANGYRDRICGFKSQNLAEAIEAYQRALEIFTPQTFPLDCLQTGKNLGNTAFDAELWDIAIEGFAVAIEAVEQSRSWATSDSRRQQIIAESIDLYEKTVQACVNAGQYEKAFEFVERSRSKYLVDLMASNDIYSFGEIPPQVKQLLEEFEAITFEIDNCHLGNIKNQQELAQVKTRWQYSAFSDRIQELEVKKQIVWEKIRQFDPVIAGQITINYPSFPSILTLIDLPESAIINFYTTTDDTYIFIARKSVTIKVITCYGQGLNTFQNWISECWLIPYIQDRVQWLNQIDVYLIELVERLQINELVAQLEGIEELIIIPHLGLHQIPFSALPIANYKDRTYLGELFRIRYIPSCQILKFCQQRPYPLFSQGGHEKLYGTVEDADRTLPFASFEGEKIARIFNIPNELRLKGRTQATVANYRQLIQKVQVLHSSHHAMSRLDKPLESKLVLADGNITLGQLMSPNWRVPNLHEVFLSCCETNLGLTGITDDLLTLSTGFLCAGARTVVSTLWSVDDLATALFSIFYCVVHRDGKNCSESVKQAQNNLRNLSGKQFMSEYHSELEMYLKMQVKEVNITRQELKSKLRMEVRHSEAYQQLKEEFKLWNHRLNILYKFLENLKFIGSQEYPFANPYYWAGFICSGLR